jgi:septal ring factor EnvC (AmiA/AmiB activator)
MLKFLSGIQGYLYAAVAAIILALSVTVYVQHVKIDGKNDKIKAVNTELSVSNQSVKGLTKSLKDVGDQLAQKEKDDIAKQATIAANLKAIAEKDKPLESMEARLKARKTTSNCPIPKDLNDAWNNL